MSTTTQWHASTEQLQAYVDGRLDAIMSASLESHANGCARCRAAIAPLMDRRFLGTAWNGVRAAAESPPLRAPMRWALSLRVPEPTAILLAAAAALRASWVSSSIIALGFATLATIASDGLLWPFFLVAPLIPVLGVAASYPSVDEAFDEVTATTPYGRVRLILVRTVGVLVTSLPLAGVLGLFLPGPPWVAAAWFGPALAMVPILMALASLIGPRLAASVIALFWCSIIVGSMRPLPATWPVEPQQQVGYLILAAVSVAVLWFRSRRTRTIGAAL